MVQNDARQVQNDARELKPGFAAEDAEEILFSHGRRGWHG